MRTDKKTKPKKKRNLTVRFVIVACVAFTLFKVVQLQVQINAKQGQIDQLQDDIQKQELLNEDLQEKADHYEDYLDQQARQEGLVRSGEQIYQIIPDN